MKNANEYTRILHAANNLHTSEQRRDLYVEEVSNQRELQSERPENEQIMTSLQMNKPENNQV